jgi:septal ring factor EnvC (AmiA/AmiB activator)
VEIGLSLSSLGVVIFGPVFLYNIDDSISFIEKEISIKEKAIKEKEKELNEVTLKLASAQTYILNLEKRIIEIHPTQAQVAKISYHHPSKYLNQNVSP